MLQSSGFRRTSIIFLACMLAFANSLPTAMSAPKAKKTQATVDPVTQVRALPKSSLILVRDNQTLLAWREETPRIPASTLKVLTALAALDTLGADYRFHTLFFLDNQGWLWVKGRADPTLTSETLGVIANKLKEKGINNIKGIGIDDSFFAPNLVIPGRTVSFRAYDAPVTSVATNFNTLVIKHQGKNISSAELQTPLTPTARRLGAQTQQGTVRISVKERENALTNFAELLAAKLRLQNIEVANEQRIGIVPVNSKLVLDNLSTATLATTVQAMLKNSSNFTANSLFLLMADPQGKGQVTLEKAQQRMSQWVKRQFGWQLFIAEGAGLSRDNYLTSTQMLKVLDAFSPYAYLLPVEADNANITGKTGTLSDVSCLIGIIRHGDQKARFVLMINQPVDYNLRFRVARQLERIAFP